MKKKRRKAIFPSKAATVVMYLSAYLLFIKAKKGAGKWQIKIPNLSRKTLKLFFLAFSLTVSTNHFTGSI